MRIQGLSMVIGDIKSKQVGQDRLAFAAYVPQLTKVVSQHPEACPIHIVGRCLSFERPLDP